jgi:lycopene beta-cyclase
MLKSKELAHKQILLIDKEPKVKNDRTWCFWEKGKGFFEEVVHRQWENISFFSDEYAAPLEIAPYKYKMIRGIDFYQYCFTEIAKHSNVEIVYTTVEEWTYEKQSIVFTINKTAYRLAGTAQVFNSLYKPAAPDKRSIKLLQHFKGWVIETPVPAFDPAQATMMDFRVGQQHGTTFAYVLPCSTTTALIEYTLFSKALLTDVQYEEGLRNYISQFLGIKEYRIKEEEFGIIPMTNEQFHFVGKGWQIGTAGGQTKASSGYTFQFIQKQSALIVDYLCKGKNLNELPGTSARFRFYDNTLLHILYYDQLPGKHIFSQLFKKNKPRQVLRFLDNESSLTEELKLISTLPTWPFLKAASKQFM